MMVSSLTSSGWFIDEKAFEAIHGEVKERTQAEKLALDTDLREFGLPSIANATKKTDNLVCGPLVLQLTRIRNVSYPKVGESSKLNDGVLRVFLTDGHASLSVLLLSTIKGLNTDTPPGTKIALKGTVPLEGCFVLPQSSNIAVLGGHVEALVEKWHIERNAGSVSHRNSENKAPKWISFGKKGSGKEDLSSKGFRANDALASTANKKENDGEDNKFEQQRKEHIDAALEAAAQKKFAAPNIEKPAETQKPPPRDEFQVKKAKAMQSDRGHDRRERKGRRGSDDGPVPAEFARPTAPSTLFDFMTSGLPADVVDAVANAPLNKINEPQGNNRREPRGGNHREQRADGQRGRFDRGPRNTRNTDSLPSGSGRPYERGAAQGPRNRDGPRRQDFQQQQAATSNNREHRDEGHHDRIQKTNNRGLDQMNARNNGNGQRNSRNPDQEQRNSARDGQVQRNYGRDSHSAREQHGRQNVRSDGAGSGQRPMRNQNAPNLNHDPIDVLTQNISQINVSNNRGATRNQNKEHSMQQRNNTRPLGGYGGRSNALPQWQIGQQCKAPWSDGGYYLATIVNMGPAEMCAVRYDDYGNIATVPVAVLVVLE